MRNSVFSTFWLVEINMLQKRLLSCSFKRSLKNKYCVKSVRIRSFSGPYFPAFELNKERYSVSLRIPSECRKIRTRKTPNRDTFHVVKYKSHLMFILLLSSDINLNPETVITTRKDKLCEVLPTQNCIFFTEKMEC